MMLEKVNDNSISIQRQRIRSSQSPEKYSLKMINRAIDIFSISHAIAESVSLIELSSYLTSGKHFSWIRSESP